MLQYLKQPAGVETVRRFLNTDCCFDLPKFHLIWNVDAFHRTIISLNLITRDVFLFEL